ncbi:MAG: sugar ABC transporter substrate-binding protein [Candidatus Tectimicrobiota bacterium]|nr:MAG: sugar ABC transporter substrate-binding protein [Candidatus Tectomicrobia bacterium]
MRPPWFRGAFVRCRVFRFLSPKLGAGWLLLVLFTSLAVAQQPAAPPPAVPPAPLPSPPPTFPTTPQAPAAPHVPTPGTAPPIPQEALPAPTPEAPAAPEGARPALPPRPAPAAAPALSPVERLLAGRLPEPAAPLRQFGYDLFAQPPTTFAPVTNVPVGPDYVLGPGDTLNIVLWGNVPEQTWQVEVSRDGTVVLPRLGVVPVWGLTLEQAQRLLQQRFSRFLTEFQLAVTLGKLRTLLVYVVGEVQQPGAYTVSALSTVINALFASGGPSKNGSLRRIELVRQGRTVHTLDLYDFLLRGDKSQDRTLQPGDTIFVPIIGPVAGVAGNVKRPAIYEITPGTTLQQLLELAGGITPAGYRQRVQVERFVANEKKVVVDLDLSTPPPAALWQTPIADGDLVRVFPVETQPENVVELRGHVRRPGHYELKPGMRLRDLLPSYEALLPDPYLEYGEIVRYVPPEGRRVVVPFNLGAVLAGEAPHNLPLQPLDLVRVFARSEFVDPGLVRVSGLVHRPGVYPLTEGMRVRDLVLRAGNVHKFAYLERAELTRLLRQDGTQTAIRLELNLRRALAGDPEHNLPLQDLDHLLVLQQPELDLTQEAVLPEAEPGVPRVPPVHPLLAADQKESEALRRAGILVEQTVELRGEVRFPGVYPILKGERLSSVLRRAGGFTAEAYLRGAVFTRESVRRLQEQRLQELLHAEEQALLAAAAAEAAGALSPEEVQGRRQELEARRQLIERLRAVRPEGRVVIRLRPPEELAGTPDDLELEPGDRLVVPQLPRHVTVVGQVYNPGSLLFVPGQTLDDYLQQVGGPTREADRREIHIVQADGTVLSARQSRHPVRNANGQIVYVASLDEVPLQPGDTIVVPRRVRTPATLRATRDIVQILFQSLSTLAVVAALL